MTTPNKSTPTNNPASQSSDLRRALEACRQSFLTTAFFSLFVNLLMLVPAIYMLAIYDRVLMSGSESTLTMITIIAVFLYLTLGGLEWIRTRIMVATSARLDEQLGERVFDAIFRQSLASSGAVATSQPLSDLLQIRQFLTGPGLLAFFDAPWMPIYAGLMFLFHPYFGVVAVLSMLVLAGLAIWNEVATRKDLAEANRESIAATQFAQRHLRNAEVVEAMGMLPRLRARWQAKQQQVLALQSQASTKGGVIHALSRTYRLTIQSLALGLGAYLAIHKDISPGLVISGSILLGRALAPLDQMIAGWRGFLGAREAYGRLDTLLRTIPERDSRMTLPELQGQIKLEDLVIAVPGRTEPILNGITLTIESGTSVALIGPSAAGKSTLARAILGLYIPARGRVCLDGADVHNWDRTQFGQSVGYLPQDVELLDGTVAENIARFGDVDAERVVEAAQWAGIHEMVLTLPQAYDTPLIGGGVALSAGQQQRIGIARAIYGRPRVVVLDEPNANLDMAGDAALMATIQQLQRDGCTVVVVTHRTNVLQVVQKIAMVVGGKLVLYGPRDEVLAAMAKVQQPAASPRPAGAVSLGRVMPAASGLKP
ncbi:MAG: type I secretion system permease/ATPase [Candidatus Krumholzibacteria bacterium]|nr:type I secretion system permease/ATPase [Candidatus Krumholzibacteria bacterium]MDH5271260.1 type I secretion system permease/ATPase [Candidatus Krumholzibacteria bacterium]